ncbi:MAG: hypothetical protein QXI89_02050 [Candidatus Anstonellales archaeon]
MEFDDKERLKTYGPIIAENKEGERKGREISKDAAEVVHLITLDSIRNAIARVYVKLKKQGKAFIHPNEMLNMLSNYGDHEFRKLVNDLKRYVSSQTGNPDKIFRALDRHKDIEKTRDGHIKYSIKLSLINEEKKEEQHVLSFTFPSTASDWRSVRNQVPQLTILILYAYGPRAYQEFNIKR